jgi:hypothetical protein
MKVWTTVMCGALTVTGCGPREVQLQALLEGPKDEMTALGEYQNERMTVVGTVEEKGIMKSRQFESSADVTVTGQGWWGGGHAEGTGKWTNQPRPYLVIVSDRATSPPVKLWCALPVGTFEHAAKVKVKDTVEVIGTFRQYVRAGGKTYAVMECERADPQR